MLLQERCGRCCTHCSATRHADKRRECISMQLRCKPSIALGSFLLFSSFLLFFYRFFSFPRAELARAHPWEFTTIHHWNAACSVQHCTTTTTTIAAIDMYARDERPVISSIGLRLYRLRPRIYIVSPTSRPLSNRHSCDSEEGNRGWKALARQLLT